MSIKNFLTCNMNIYYITFTSNAHGIRHNLECIYHVYMYLITTGIYLVSLLLIINCKKLNHSSLNYRPLHSNCSIALLQGSWNMVYNCRVNCFIYWIRYLLTKTLAKYISICHAIEQYLSYFEGVYG